MVGREGKSADYADCTDLQEERRPSSGFRLPIPTIRFRNLGNLHNLWICLSHPSHFTLHPYPFSDSRLLSPDSHLNKTNMVFARICEQKARTLAALFGHFPVTSRGAGRHLCVRLS